MSIGETLVIDCDSLNDSLLRAVQIGRNLRGRETIELISDLGGGKTTFVRGLAEGMGSSDHVSSPSFTISNRYDAADLTMYHFDFYRLQDPGIIRDELSEVLDDSRAVTVIEWADIVADVLPSKRLTISITATGETSRQLTLQTDPSHDYLLAGLR